MSIPYLIQAKGKKLCDYELPQNITAARIKVAARIHLSVKCEIKEWKYPNFVIFTAFHVWPQGKYVRKKEI